MFEPLNWLHYQVKSGHICLLLHGKNKISVTSDQSWKGVDSLFIGNKLWFVCGLKIHICSLSDNVMFIDENLTSMFVYIFQADSSQRHNIIEL